MLFTLISLISFIELILFSRFFIYFVLNNSQMFRIRPQRNELREEIQDVLLLVENSYLEEERKNDESDIYLKSQEKKLTNLRNKRKLGGQKR
jgi:hypothetical protein